MILERIKEYIDYKGLTISKFEQSVGMSNATFGSALKRGGAIGTDKLENILSTYPDLSPLWVVTGEGSMIRIQEIESSSLLIIIKSQEKTISYLRERLETLEGKKNPAEVG